MKLQDSDHGYWAMCSAAFSYLYDIDDSSYRRELVYPADLIEYARTKAPWTGDEQGVLPTRVIGGQFCPRAEFWFTPSEPHSKKISRLRIKCLHRSQAAMGSSFGNGAMISDQGLHIGGGCLMI